MGSSSGSTGSRGSSGGGASPGRSTPGSPSASDGKRGSSMGAGGGSAPGTSSGGGGGGSRTNPGRPGGEAGPSVDGSDGYSGYSGNSDTSSFGSSSGGSESIRGAKAASFSFNSPEAGEMASFRADRQMARSLDGVGSFGLNGTDQGGVASGLFAGGGSLDTTTPGYKAVVGDGDLSESEQAREAYAVNKLNTQPKADTIALGQDMADNTNESFANRTKMPGVGVLQAVGAIGRNAMMANDVAGENQAMADSRNLNAPGVNANDVGNLAAGMNSASLSDTTGGLLGNAMAPAQAALGDYAAPTPNTPRGGDSSSSGITNEYEPQERLPDRPLQPQNPATGNGFGYGRLTNYGSYRRRVLNRLG